MSSSTRRTILIALAVLVIGGVAFVAISRRPMPGQATPAVSGLLPKAPVTVLQGSVQAAERLELKAPAAGKIVALGAGEGLNVIQDQLIVQVDSAEARQQVRAAQANAREVEARVRKSRAGKVREQIASAATELQSATAYRQQAEKALADLQAKQPKTTAAQTAYKEAEQAAALAARQYESASKALDAAQRRTNTTGKPDPDINRLQEAFGEYRAHNQEALARLDVTRQALTRLRETLGQLARAQRNVESSRRREKQAEDSLSRLQRSPEAKAATEGDKLIKIAQDGVKAAEAKLAQCAVLAPETGRLSELRVRPGSQVQAGQTLAVLERQGGARMVFEVPVAEAASLSVGQKAQVSPEGWKPFSAAVSQIVPGPRQTRVYLQPLGKTPLPATGTALAARLR